MACGIIYCTGLIGLERAMRAMNSQYCTRMLNKGLLRSANKPIFEFCTLQQFNALIFILWSIRVAGLRTMWFKFLTEQRSLLIEILPRMC